MIQKKQISLLAAVAVVLFLAALFVQTGDPSGDLTGGEVLLPELAAHLNEVTELSITTGDGRVTVQKGENGWSVAEKAGYPAKFETVKKTLMALAGLKTLEPKTANPDYYAKLEVEDAESAEAKSRRVTVTGPSVVGVAADLIVGKRRSGSSGGLEMVYVRKAGDAQAWLAEGILSIEGDPLNWLRREIVSIDRDRVAEVRLTRPTGEVLVIAKAAPEDKDYMVEDLPVGAELKSTADVGYIASALYGLQLDDVRTSADLMADLAGAQAAGSASYRTFDGLVLDINLWRDGEETWTQYAASITGADAGEDVAAQVLALNEALGGWAYRVPSYKLTKFESTLAGLLKEEEAAPAPGKDGS